MARDGLPLQGGHYPLLETAPRAVSSGFVPVALVQIVVPDGDDGCQVDRQPVHRVPSPCVPQGLEPAPTQQEDGQQQQQYQLHRLQCLGSLIERWTATCVAAHARHVVRTLKCSPGYPSQRLLTDALGGHSAGPAGATFQAAAAAAFSQGQPHLTVSLLTFLGAASPALGLSPGQLLLGTPWGASHLARACAWLRGVEVRFGCMLGFTRRYLVRGLGPAADSGLFTASPAQYSRACGESAGKDSDGGTFGEGGTTERRLTVQQYFEEELCVRLCNPQLPTVRVGSSSRPLFLPMELLEVVLAQPVAHSTLMALEQPLDLVASRRKLSSTSTSARSWHGSSTSSSSSNASWPAAGTTAALDPRKQRSSRSSSGAAWAGTSAAPTISGLELQRSGSSIDSTVAVAGLGQGRAMRLEAGQQQGWRPEHKANTEPQARQKQVRLQRQQRDQQQLTQQHRQQQVPVSGQRGGVLRTLGVQLGRGRAASRCSSTPAPVDATSLEGTRPPTLGRSKTSPQPMLARPSSCSQGWAAAPEDGATRSSPAPASGSAAAGNATVGSDAVLLPMQATPKGGTGGPTPGRGMAAGRKLAATAASKCLMQQPWAAHGMGHGQVECEEKAAEGGFHSAWRPSTPPQPPEHRRPHTSGLEATA